MSSAGRFPTARSMKIDDLLQVYDNIIPDADKVLEESQIAGPLPIPGQPTGTESYLQWAQHSDPLPPDDLTDVPPLILGKLFSFFQNWTNYVAAEVTRAKSTKDVLERHLKVIKAALNRYYKEEESVPANAVEDYIFTDERFVEIDSALLRVKVFYDAARSREDQLRRTLNNISREQTRRSDELERQLHDERGGYSRGKGGEDSPFTGGKAARKFRR